MQHSPVKVIVRMKDDFAPLYVVNSSSGMWEMSHDKTKAEILPHCCAVEMLEKYYGPKFYELYECVLHLENTELKTQCFKGEK